MPDLPEIPDMPNLEDIPNPARPDEVIDDLPIHTIPPKVPVVPKEKPAAKKKSGLVIALLLWAGYELLEHRGRRG
jgi:hypothetical protein